MRQVLQVSNPFKFITLCLLTFLPIAPGPWASEDYTQIHSFHLSNGLPVIFKARPGTGMVEQRLVVDAGFNDARDCALLELPHLVEHLMFKGTHRFSETALDRQVTAMGGYWNATTGSNQTVYEMSVPKAKLGEGLALLAHVLADPAFDEGAVARAKEVVYRENGGKTSWWYGQLQGQGLDRSAFDWFYEARFGKEWNCFGPEDYSAITRAHALTFIDTHYSLDNMVLVVVGEVPVAKLRRQLEQAYEGFPVRRGGSREVSMVARLPGVRRFVGWYLPDAEPQTGVSISFVAPDRFSKDVMALRWLEAYLDERLFERLPLCAVENVFDDLEPNGPGKEVTLNVDYPNPNDRFQIDTNLGSIHVVRIVFIGEIFLTSHTVPLSTSVCYRKINGGETVSEVATFDPDGVPGFEFSIEMHRLGGTGETHVLLRRK